MFWKDVSKTRSLFLFLLARDKPLTGFQCWKPNLQSFRIHSYKPMHTVHWQAHPSHPFLCFSSAPSNEACIFQLATSNIDASLLQQRTHISCKMPEFYKVRTRIFLLLNWITMCNRNSRIFVFVNTIYYSISTTKMLLMIIIWSDAQLF